MKTNCCLKHDQVKNMTKKTATSKWLLTSKVQRLIFSSPEGSVELSPQQSAFSCPFTGHVQDNAYLTKILHESVTLEETAGPTQRRGPPPTPGSLLPDCTDSTITVSEAAQTLLRPPIPLESDIGDIR